MTKRITRLRLYFFGLKIGFFSFIRGYYKISIKRIILPINYWRVTIFKIVANYVFNMEISEKEALKVLDIGSPKLLSLFFGSRIESKIYATDLQDKAIFLEWEKYYHSISYKNNIVFEYANAKELTYPDDYFDIVYSLSVVHMITPGGNGDILALKEIQKKLKPGGRLILEIPYREQYFENYEDRNNFEEEYLGTPIFIERQYDEAALESRIISNIHGRLNDKIILYEKIPFDCFWGKVPKAITNLLAFIEPWIDMANISIAKNESQRKKGKSVILFFTVRR